LLGDAPINFRSTIRAPSRKHQRGRGQENTRSAVMESSKGQSYCYFLDKCFREAHARGEGVRVKHPGMEQRRRDFQDRRKICFTSKSRDSCPAVPASTSLTKIIVGGASHGERLAPARGYIKIIGHQRNRMKPQVSDSIRRHRCDDFFTAPFHAGTRHLAQTT